MTSVTTLRPLVSDVNILKNTCLLMDQDVLASYLGWQCRDITVYVGVYLFEKEKEN